MRFTKLHKQLASITRKYPAKIDAIKNNRGVAREIINEYKVLGQGVFRFALKVYSDDGTPVALKVIRDKGCFGMGRYAFFHSNKIEWNLYKHISKRYKCLAKFILKPLAFFKINGHEFIVYPLITKISPKVSGWNKKVVKAIESNLSDTEGHNWGLHNKVPKVFDLNIWKHNELNKEIDNVFKALLSEKKRYTPRHK